MVQNSEEQEMLGESQIASGSCVSTIKWIFMAVVDDADLVKELGEIVFPVIL